MKNNIDNKSIENKEKKTTKKDSNTVFESSINSLDLNVEDPIKNFIFDKVLEQHKKGTIKTGSEIFGYLTSLTEPLLDALLKAELDNHLEYPKYEHQDKDNKTRTNTRNGSCTPKKVKTKSGTITARTPRDRNATFEPICLKKGETTLDDNFEDICITLYAKGLSLREIEATIKKLYNVNLNKDHISGLVSAVANEAETWRNRPLKPLYSFVYADCVFLPVKGTSNKKAIYVLVGVDSLGFKDILGIWIANTESAKFWSSVFNDIKKRGVQDILYITSDGIAGFKNSLKGIFPDTISIRCVVHLSRNISELCTKDIRKPVLAGFKKIYNATSLNIAKEELVEFKKQFNEEKHNEILEKVDEYMTFLTPLFDLPSEIRNAIYTSNAVESVNSTIKSVSKYKGAFPSDEAVFKLLYLRLKDLTDKWNKPITNWNIIQAQLTTIFGERFTKHTNS